MGEAVAWDKADIAIAIAILSAAFSAWQAVAAHRSAQVAVASTRRKRPVFEVSSRPSDQFAGWTSISIVARNYEPVSVRIHAYTYRGGRIANPDDFDPDAAYRDGPQQSVEEIAQKNRAAAQRRIGAAGEQAPRSMAPHVVGPTAHLQVLVEGAFDAKRLGIEWSWADGQKP